MSEMIFSPHSSYMTRSQPKSALRQWFDSMGSGTLARAKPHISETGHVLRSGAESAVVGGALGYAAAIMKTGLDLPVPGHANVKVPVDGLVAAAGLGGAVMLAHEPVAADLRNAGAAALAILSYRKTKAFAEEKAKVSSKPAGVHGDASMGADEDPILVAARAL